ncbi:MAG: lipoprotein releasing system ATP-binding protein [Candidatus Midichloriaceae bacterium]|jgi:lipoprotein-releasing system ATP-binding protein|nr:lipoprotein releasing system ATP-binding protein [Candidatus Midichloriaceae bacterium]
MLTLSKVSKDFVQANGSLEIIREATFGLNEGEVVAMVGPSGCGKSTLLHICGLLEQPTSGSVIIDGVDCSKFSDVEATKIRGKKIGFIYQFHHLLPEFTALENVMMPLLIAGASKKLAAEKANNLLEEFSLLHRAGNIPSELSGGEQQRVAIARALIHQPKILLADEPTGNLDEENAKFVFSQFLKIARNKKVSVLMVTHNLELAEKTDRILTIHGGVVDAEPKVVHAEANNSIRPLRKLASGSRVEGAHGTEDRSVFNIHEVSCTGALRQPAAEVEFPERSIKKKVSKTNSKSPKKKATKNHSV